MMLPWRTKSLGILKLSKEWKKCVLASMDMEAVSDEHDCSQHLSWLAHPTNVIPWLLIGLLNRCHSLAADWLIKPMSFPGCWLAHQTDVIPWLLIGSSNQCHPLAADWLIKLMSFPGCILPVLLFSLFLLQQNSMANMSHDMAKPAKWVCAQWRLRSAWASAKGPRFLHVDSEDSDQTGRMPRLIWVFAGRTGHFVGFVMRRLTLLTAKDIRVALHDYGNIKKHKFSFIQ